MESRATQLTFVCPRISHLITIMPASQLHINKIGLVILDKISDALCTPNLIIRYLSYYTIGILSSDAYTVYTPHWWLITYLAIIQYQQYKLCCKLVML